MRLIKLYTFMLFDMVKHNVGKTIPLCLIITSFSLMGTFENTKDEYKIVQQSKIGDSYLYTYYTIDNNKIKYQLIQSDGTPLKLTKDIYTSYSTSGFNIFFYIMFGISMFIQIMMLLIGEDDAKWNFRESSARVLSRYIVCEEEKGKFYYTLFGRLIGVTDHLIGYYRSSDYAHSVINELSIYTIGELKLCPKYKTKVNKRNSILEDMGI